jgi:hypothetical protein
VDPASSVHSFSAFGALGDIAVVVACAPSNTNTPTAFLGDNLRVDLDRMLLYRVLVLNGQDTPSTIALTAPTGPAFVGVKVDLQALVARADGSFFVTNSTHLILKQ